MKIIKAHELTDRLSVKLSLITSHNFENTPTYFALNNLFLGSLNQWNQINKNSEIINFELSDYETSDFKSTTHLYTFLHSIYKDLSFYEVSSLWKSLGQLNANSNTNSESDSEVNKIKSNPLNPELFFSTFGFRYNENLEQLLNKFDYVTEDFLLWVAQKKWAPQDFAPLRAVELDQIKNLNPLLTKMSQGPFSKSEATLVFEYVIELFLMGHTQLNEVLARPFSLWMNELKKLRFPLQAELQAKEEALLSKIHWPSQAQGKWVQRGDRSGIELKLFFSHPQELSKILQKLEAINESFTQDGELKKLWTL